LRATSRCSRSDSVRLAPLQQLDQVHAEAADDRVGDLAGLQRVEHLLELGHEHAGAGPAQVAAVAALASCEFSRASWAKSAWPACDPALEVGQLLARLRSRSAARRAQQDVAAWLWVTLTPAVPGCASPAP
jgi:hypothetical protein